MTTETEVVIIYGAPVADASMGGLIRVLRAIIVGNSTVEGIYWSLAEKRIEQF